MKIDEIRVYAEVLEQGIDFKEYLMEINAGLKVSNIYTKKARSEILSSDSLTTRIRKSKDVDVLITALSDENEYPILMVEYSTAVPTDDHKMQRADVYYWSSVYHVPMMKIYPNSKGMGQAFGGGDKFTDELEIVLAYNQGAIFYPIQWETMKELDTLKTKENALSCIYYSIEIRNILSNIYNSFLSASDFRAFFVSLRTKYHKDNERLFVKYTEDKLKAVIVDSTRFKWCGSKLVSKINRFGHAMDPDRGVLYFTNMLVGVDNCVTEIMINRESVDGRGSYKSLFDSCPREKQLRKKVDELITKQGNVFGEEDALYLLENALCIERWHLFEKSGERTYTIKDSVLKEFLLECPSMTSKCIFYLSTQLNLTDKDRKIICKIVWNSSVISQYLQSLDTKNYAPISIKKLCMRDAKEDIITFASIELYRRLKCDLIAVSYPGAQGDRCVLLGKGRKVLRTYIDIIALQKNDSKVTVFLEECKGDISKSKKDAEKLNDFISSKAQMNGLANLIKKVSGINQFNEVKISVGAKHSQNVPTLDVNYIFVFEIRDDILNNTVIDYSIVIKDASLKTTFNALADENGELKGSLTYAQIYTIK